MGKGRQKPIHPPRSKPHWNKYGFTPLPEPTNPQTYRNGQRNITLTREQLSENIEVKQDA